MPTLDLSKNNWNQVFDFDEAYTTKPSSVTNPRFRLVPSFASTGNAELMAWELFTVLGGARATDEGVWDSSAVQRAQHALTTVPQLSSLLDGTLDSLTFFQLRDLLAGHADHQDEAGVLKGIEAFLHDAHRKYQSRKLLPKSCALLLPLDFDDHTGSESQLTNPTVPASAMAAPQLVIDRARLLSTAHADVEPVYDQGNVPSISDNEPGSDEDDLLLREAASFQDDPVVAHLALLMQTYREALAATPVVPP